MFSVNYIVAMVISGTIFTTALFFAGRRIYLEYNYKSMIDKNQEEYVECIKNTKDSVNIKFCFIEGEKND